MVNYHSACSKQIFITSYILTLNVTVHSAQSIAMITTTTNVDGQAQ